MSEPKAKPSDMNDQYIRLEIDKQFGGPPIVQFDPLDRDEDPAALASEIHGYHGGYGDMNYSVVDEADVPEDLRYTKHMTNIMDVKGSKP